jgi:hypothetical protein
MFQRDGMFSCGAVLAPTAQRGGAPARNRRLCRRLFGHSFETALVSLSRIWEIGGSEGLLYSAEEWERYIRPESSPLRCDHRPTASNP